MASLLENWILYFFFAYLLTVITLEVRFWWLGLKFRKYLWKNHPQKAGDFGCPLDGWFNGFKFGNALYKRHDIDDPEFLHLKNKAKRAQTYAILATSKSISKQTWKMLRVNTTIAYPCMYTDTEFNKAIKIAIKEGELCSTCSGKKIENNALVLQIS